MRRERRLFYSRRSGTLRLEMKAEFYGFSAWRDIVRPAEGGVEIVECFFIGQIDDREAQAPLVAVAVEQVVVAERQVEQAPRLDALWIVIVILGVRRRYFHQIGPKLGCGTNRR